MEKRSKTNPILWATFLDFAEANPVILTKKFDSVHGRQRYDELWKEIAATLNSMGYLQKTVEKWQKAVADWKSKVKGKAADINKGLNKTGGGGPLPPLNENERRLMAIIGWSVTGTNTAELGFGFKTNEVSKENAVLEENAVSSALVVQNYNLCDNETASEAFSPPPPLCYPTTNLASTCNVTTETSTEPSKPLISLNTASTPHSTPSNHPQKRKFLSATRKMDTSSTPQSRFKENIATRNMQQMHTETLGVLKEINSNLGRMADTQQKICSILEILVTTNAEVDT